MYEEYTLRIFLSKTYGIEDCTFYHPLTDNSANNHITNSGMTYSYSSSGLAVTNGNWGGIWLNYTLPTDCTVEMDLTVSGSNSPKFYCGLVSEISTDNDQIEFSSNSDGAFKIEKEGTSVKQYLDTTLVSTLSYSQSTAYWKCWTGGTRKFTIKNLKVKPL